MSMLLKLLQAKLDSSGLDWVKIHSLQISPGKKLITAELLLAGEDAPVRLEATYLFTDANEVKIESVTTSRRWMTEVAGLALLKTGSTFALPDGMKGRLIRFFL